MAHRSQGLAATQGRLSRRLPDYSYRAVQHGALRDVEAEMAVNKRQNAGQVY
jgi:hypothetical protein